MCSDGSTLPLGQTPRTNSSKPPKGETTSNLPYNIITLLDSLDETLAAALELTSPKLKGRRHRIAVMQFGKYLMAFMEQLAQEQHLLPKTQGSILNVLNR